MRMYQEAREAAGLTQRQAAERLHIGIRTLRAYELGDVVPKPDVVMLMARVYRQPELTVMYCRRECAIGQVYSYEPEATTLERSFLRLLKEFQDVENRLQKDIAGVVDGKIGHEMLRELMELEHAIETLKLCAARAYDIAGLIREHNERQKEKDRFVAAK